MGQGAISGQEAVAGYSSPFVKSKISINLLRTPRCSILNPFPNDKSKDSSKLKEFADDNFKSDKNGSNFSKRVENTMRKGEIAHFHFSHYVFNYLNCTHVKIMPCLGKVLLLSTKPQKIPCYELNGVRLIVIKLDSTG